ncbi:integrase, partial [Salmonella enterica subsp. enterica]|nr:integrase [Salmonella enterica subsp. enterica serovar Java]
MLLKRRDLATNTYKICGNQLTTV